MTPRLFPPMLAVALLLSGRSASAQVQIEGRVDAVHLEANDASLREVLDELHDRFNLRYRSNDALETRKTGAFNGPLRRVVARVLEGYDYAMTITPQGIDVLVLRQGATSAAVVTPTTAFRPPLTAAEASHFKSGHLR